MPYNWKYKFEIELVDNLVDKLSDKEIDSMNKIKENPAISQIEIASILGIGKTTVQRTL